MKSLITQKISLPERYTVEITHTHHRDSLVAVAQEILEVTCAADQELAASIGSNIQREIKEVAAARKELAEPLNQAAKRLIQLENEHCAPLLAEKERLGRLVTAFQASERIRIEKEQRARQEELKRLEMERQRAAKAAQKAEGRSDMVKLAQAEQKAFEAQEAAMEVMRRPDPVAIKGKGTATRQKLCWRCTDIVALYAARPDLCTIEPKASAIIATCDPSRPIDGLELWFEQSTSFRSA